MRTRGLHNPSQMAAFLSSLKSTAEQLTDLERLTLILQFLPQAAGSDSKLLHR